MVAWASFDSRGGASSTTPAHLPMISVSSCEPIPDCRCWDPSSTARLLYPSVSLASCNTAM